MSALNNSLLLGQEGGGGYAISRSVRLNSADSAYFSRTPASAGNRKTWTWAGWVKRSSLVSGGTYNNAVIFSAGGSNPGFILGFDKDSRNDAIQVNISRGTNAGCLTNAVFRDFSAWMHICLAFDTTQATSANRLRLWVNGVEQTWAQTNYPAQHTDYEVNNTSAHNIGRASQSSAEYFDGLLADLHFCDGTAYDASAFGEFDANGIWQPKKFAGVYGTNGFKLSFSDNSTAAALGTDSSGAGNTWSVNNISVYSATSINWSSTYPLYSGTPYLAFDGSTSGVCQLQTGGSLTVNFAPGIPVSSNVELYTESSTYISGAKINGGATVSNPNGSTGYWTLPFSGVMTSLQLFTTGVGAAQNWGNTRVDGNNLIIPVNGAAGNDSLVDVPTNGSEVDTGSGGQVRGNYCTANPLDIAAGSGIAFANGNLDVVLANAETRGTLGVPASGKWYYEVTVTRLYNDGTGTFGLTAGFVKTDNSGFCGVVPMTADPYGISGVYANGSRVQTVTGVAQGDVFGFALDLDALTLQVYRNGSSYGSAATVASASYKPRLYGSGSNTSNGVSGSLNFGQRPFAFPVSGFKALCTANLPAPVVTKPSEYMDVKLYTGNGSTQVITTGFSPDLVWIKSRSVAYWHRVNDSVRGAQKFLYSNATDAEGTSTLNDRFTSFDATGFTLGIGDSPSADGLNQNTLPYVAWCWDAGSSTVTNTQGSITSQVRANPSAGFSVVTYTGTGSAATVGHGLGVAPSLLIVKQRNAVRGWSVYHKDIGASYYLQLERTDAKGGPYSGLWNDTAPTSTVFSILNDGGSNANGGTYVAYCFAPVAGYSSFGSYTGNGSADGPFVFCNFRPRWLMIKCSSAGTTSWQIVDATRPGYNVIDLRLRADTSESESSLTNSFNNVDFLSNGFKIRGTAGLDTNTNGATYIYAAFAESPFQYARAR